MEKGYYATHGVKSNTESLLVAIHNKNGKGLLLHLMPRPNNASIKRRNPQ